MALPIACIIMSMQATTGGTLCPGALGAAYPFPVRLPLASPPRKTTPPPPAH